MELLENTSRNKHAIELIEGKPPSYKPIYDLILVELEPLKAYIKTDLKTRFILPFKFPVSAVIFFNQKPDDSLCLCVDYRGQNNLTIKNRNPISLLGEVLDCLGRAK